VKQKTELTTSRIADVGTWAWRIAAIIAERRRRFGSRRRAHSRSVHNGRLAGVRPRCRPFHGAIAMRIIRTLCTLAGAGWLAMSLPLAVVGPASAQTTAAVQNRVVLQVSDNDPAKWNLALNNARNLQADLGAGNVEIEIVAYGPGIGMLKHDSVVGTRVGEALASGVRVEACENTMRGQKLAQTDMLNGIGYVPAGVVEIMQKQQQGWAYLRP